MYDIAITPQGCYDISTGDFRTVGKQASLSQKLYRAIMSMPANLAIGAPQSSREEITRAIRQYCNMALSHDIDIDPVNIVITVQDMVDSLGVAFTIGYRTFGTNDSDSDLSFIYKHGEGVILSIDTDPAWLSGVEPGLSEQVRESVYVPALTDTIEVSRRPLTETVYDDRPQLIYLTLPGADLSVRRTVPFTIITNSTKKIYPIARTCGVQTGTESIESVLIANATIAATVEIYNGEQVIIAHGNGTVNGQADVISAIQVAREYTSERLSVYDLPYPLRPVSGRYMVLFPKTIKPGWYDVYYTAYKRSLS